MDYSKSIRSETFAFKIQPVYSTRSIDVAGGDTNNGANVLLCGTHSGENQQWISKR